MAVHRSSSLFVAASRRLGVVTTPPLAASGIDDLLEFRGAP